jgi:DedD protein
MDQGLKERLIGAAVLVALGVWLIPWVLDGQSEQSESRTSALQLPVPEQPVPLRSQTIRLDEERQAPAPPAESTAQVATGAGGELTAGAEPPSGAESTAGAEPTITAELAAAEPVAVAEPAPATTVGAAGVVADESPPVVTAALAERDVTSSQAAAPPKREAAAASSAPDSSAQTGWLVQLGSFSEEANARRLAQRVSTFGYRADITSHRTSGRVMYRVRVGPESSRGRAQAAASALSAHGFPAQVVAAD